jgi:hypothetical protein
MIRKRATNFLITAVRASECASLIGLSNMGKSALMRELGGGAVREAFLGGQDDDWLFVYVDCNLMPERSERALHEVVLRNVLESLRRAGGRDNVRDKILARLDELYQQVVEPPTPIRSPLAFNDAINVLCRESGRALVLLFDEFDDPFEKLDGRIFLNLRATKDRLGNTLTYITATERPLGDIRADREASEFIELFSAREIWIGFLNGEDARAVAAEFAEANGVAWQADELDFVVTEAGGHPGLLQAVLEKFAAVAAGAPESARRQALSVARASFDDDAPIRRECHSLWQQMSDAEREALMAWAAGESPAHDALELLQTKGLLPRDDDPADTRPAIGDVWRRFVNRQGLARRGADGGVRVDVESGEVYVGRKRVDQLTELEYKLILLLYGRLNKIVDKYTIVTQVWGENYLDEVDDARIEKLVSRLRAKLEPNPEEPRYLVTIRGRGYKMVG